MSTERVVEVLKPNSSVPLKDKLIILEEFSRTLKEPISREQSQEILNLAPLGLFYYGLGLENEKQTQLLCDIIHKLLSPLKYQEITSSENKNFLIEGLTHYDVNIRLLSVRQVFKCLESTDSITAMVHSDVFMHIVITLSFQDTKTAQKASELLYEVSKTIPGQQVVLSNTTCGILRQLLTVSETVKFRIYELMIKTASSSNQAFEACESTGLLKAFLDELKSEDLLVKLNAIELLNEIAATHSGITFLEKAQLVESMLMLLQDDQDEDVFVCLMKCSLIKFIGNLGENVKIPFDRLSRQYGIMKSLDMCLDSENEEVVIVTISSIGLIGSHLMGLELIIETGIDNKIVEKYTNSMGPVKAVILQSLSKLLSVRESDNLTKDLFKQLNGFIDCLIRDAKQPDDTICAASFASMQSIAYHSWGVETMAQSDRLIDYLLDRSTERCQQGQTWKYAIIQTLSSHPDCKKYISVDHYNQLQLYIQQGPFYKPLETTVAFESN